MAAQEEDERDDDDNEDKDDNDDDTGLHEHNDTQVLTFFCIQLLNAFITGTKPSKISISTARILIDAQMLHSKTAVTMKET
jgi:hypothetical protein